MHIYVSAIMYRTLQNVSSIKQRIIEMTEEEQMKFWGKSTDNIEERLENWLTLVEENLKVSSDLIANNKKLTVYESSSGEQICKSIKSEFISRLRCIMKKIESLR